MPEEFGYIMRWFWETLGPNDLTYAEIGAWAQVTRTRVLPWEAQLLKSIDRIFRKVQRE